MMITSRTNPASEDVRSRVRKIILDKLTNKQAFSADFDDDTPLYIPSHGSYPCLDSLEIITTFLEIEDEFGVSLEDERMSIEDVNTVNKMTHHIQQFMSITSENGER